MGPVRADIHNVGYRRADGASHDASASAAIRHREIVFGEALLAMSVFAGLDPQKIPDRRARDLLDYAYRVMHTRRSGFSPSDFALYFLSTLLDHVEPEKHRLLRRGAARYLILNRQRLSRDIAALDPEARGLLASSGAETQENRAVVAADGIDGNEHGAGTAAWCETHAMTKADTFVFAFGEHPTVLELFNRT